jgi:hypothetical protein
MAVKTEDDPRRFLHPDTIARISRLDLRARQVVEGFVSGMHRSPFFGHSVEFIQHRSRLEGLVQDRQVLHQAVRGRDQPAQPPGRGRQQLDALRQDRQGFAQQV